MASDVCNSKIRGGGTLSPGPSPSPPDKGRGTDPIEMIAEGKHSIEAVCRASKMSILELADHVCTAQNLETLARVKQLHAIEREMLLGKLKRDALVRLAELTDEVPGGSADEIRAFEVMRRACRDLLRYGGLNTEKRSSRPGGTKGYPGGGYHTEPLTPAFEAEVLEALERLGREDGEKEEEVYPQITQIAQIEDSTERMNRGGFKSESESGNGDGDENQYESRASGEPQGPPELTTRTGGTPMPPLEILTNHTCPPACPPGRGRMTVPLYVRSNQSRIMKSDRNMRFDDAHPP